MSYKSILTFLPTPESADRALPLAFRVAERFDAHVSGFHVIHGIQYYSAVELYVPEDVYQTQRDAFREQAEKIAQRFASTASGSAQPSDWKCDDEFHADYLNAAYKGARSSDLIVVSHETPEALDLDWDLASSLAMECGRPVLTIPEAARTDDVGTRVAIAWNGSREATRAVFDALPFLKTANDVLIIAVDEPSSSLRQSFSSADDIATTLSRHGVHAEIRSLQSNGFDPARVILEQATAQGSDLLVMGCYGHSRLNEFVFGGTTRETLKSATLPLLLSN